MDYDQALRTFQVVGTARQKRKWLAGRGRAFVLASHFENVHAAREQRNARREAELAGLTAQLNAAEAVTAQLQGAELTENEAAVARLEGLTATLVAEMEDVPASINETQAWLDQRSYEGMTR